MCVVGCLRKTRMQPKRQVGGQKILIAQKSFVFSYILLDSLIIAGSLEAAYSLNWGAQEIWGKGGGETLALL